jgi:hypothetical protein
VSSNSPGKHTFFVISIESLRSHDIFVMTNA